MAFAAVTILMDTLHQHFLQPTPRFPLRNKTKVRLLYKHLSSLQTSLEQDFKVGECDEALKALEAQMRDVSIELRFQIEHQLRLFYLGKSMKLRLHSAKKLLPIFTRAKEDIETIYRDLNEDDIETMDLESFVLRMVESMDFNGEVEPDLEYIVLELAGEHVTLPVSKKLRLRWAQEYFHTVNGVVKGGDLKYVMEMLWKHFTLPVSGMPPHINKRIKSFCAHYAFLFRNKEESEDEKESEDEEETEDEWENKEEQKSDDEQGIEDEQESGDEKESEDEKETEDEWEKKEEQKSDDEQRSKDEQEEEESDDEQGSQNEQEEEEEEESDDECETEVIQPILSEAESIIRKELRAPSYLNKYMKQRIEARHKIHQIFMQGIKLTSYIKKEVLKVKNAYYNQSNTPQGNNTSSASLRGPEGENITVEDEDCDAADAFVISELMGLVHLRFLRSYSALKLNTLPLFMLWNLQRLEFDGDYSQNESLNIWGLPQLKKLITHRGNIRLVPPRSVHHNLESIAFLDYRSCTEELFMRIPNLRILGVDKDFKINLEPKVWFGSLACLYKLEYLKVRGDPYKCSTIHSMGTLSIENVLPNLKTLKLDKTYFNWDSLNIVGMLPKLEVLILKGDATFGKKWKPKDGGFHGLKLLSIYYCDLQIWEATSGHFPVLECLVLMGMSSLKKIPSDFADIATLKSIKLYDCLKSAISSAKCIQEEQREYGNNDFSVDILRLDF
nr:putative disease resistance RPP13-like protein 3 [Ipomoea batatas]